MDIAAKDWALSAKGGAMEEKMKITKHDIEDLCRAAGLAGFNVEPSRLDLEIWKAGEMHVPVALTPNRAAVYMFVHNNEFLKVGKANSKSNARYQYQHYSADSCRSNLAKSISRDKDFKARVEFEIGSWIRVNMTRYNILIPVELGKDFLHFAEAFFRLKCRPRFEGG